MSLAGAAPAAFGANELASRPNGRRGCAPSLRRGSKSRERLQAPSGRGCQPAHGYGSRMIADSVHKWHRKCRSIKSSLPLLRWRTCITHGACTAPHVQMEGAPQGSCGRPRGLLGPLWGCRAAGAAPGPANKGRRGACACGGPPVQASGALCVTLAVGRRSCTASHGPGRPRRGRRPARFTNCFTTGLPLAYMSSLIIWEASCLLARPLP